MNLTRCTWSPRSMIRLRACWAVHPLVGYWMTPRMRRRRVACLGAGAHGQGLLVLCHCSPWAESGSKKGPLAWLRWRRLPGEAFQLGGIRPGGRVEDHDADHRGVGHE